MSTITFPFLQTKKLRYRFNNLLRVVHLVFGQASVWSSGACLECLSFSPPLFTAPYLSELHAVHSDTFYSIVFFFYIFEIFKFSYTLQCCVSFCCTAKWFSYVYTYTPRFWISFPFKSPQSIEQSSLTYTVCSHQLSILYTASVVYVCQSQSPNSSHRPLSPLVDHMFVLYVSVSIFALGIRPSIPFFQEKYQ